jgi:signal transduction histidine kinase
MTRIRAVWGGIIALFLVECFLVVTPILPRAYSPPLIASVGDTLAALAFVVGGLIGTRARPSSRVGVLMILVGVGSLLPDGFYVNLWPVQAVALLIGSIYVVVLAHLFLSFPTGRLTSRFDRGLLFALYVSVPLAGISFLFLLPASTALCPSCPVEHGGIEPNVAVGVAVARLFDAAWLIAVVVALIRFLRVWLRATPLKRRVIAPVAWAAGPVATVLLASFTLQIANGALTGSQAPNMSGILLIALSKISIALLPIGFLLGLLRTRMDRSAVGNLVIELGRSVTPDRIEASLRRVLHDPTLRIIYWFPKLAGYRDGNGVPAELERENGRRVEKVISSTGEELAAVVFDGSGEEDRELVTAALAAARMALENGRLHAEIRSQLEEVRSSRKRLQEAGDAERRRIERNLHDGAQQRLVTLALAINLAREEAVLANDTKTAAMLADSGKELLRALEELRELARGIHPSVLVQAGLVPALRSLADRCALPVEVTAPSQLPPLSESAAATLYFVASEALTNAVKHSHARNVTIRIDATDGWVSLEIADDGGGGAQIGTGSGLSGLSDRVAAAGGVLRVTSRTDDGTRVSAEIPCE